MQKSNLISVWVFNEHDEHFATAIFGTMEEAIDWIIEKEPVGILTRYDLGVELDEEILPEHYHFEEEDDYERWRNRRNAPSNN